MCWKYYGGVWWRGECSEWLCAMFLFKAENPLAMQQANILEGLGCWSPNESMRWERILGTKGLHSPLMWGTQEISVQKPPVLSEPFHEFDPNISTFLQKRGKNASKSTCFLSSIFFKTLTTKIEADRESLKEFFLTLSFASIFLVYEYPIPCDLQKEKPRFYLL